MNTHHVPASARAPARHVGRRSFSVIGSAVLLAFLASCSSGGARNQSAPGKNIKTFSLTDDPRLAISPVDPLRGKVISAAELRGLLDRLLSEHSALAVHMMRAVVDDSTDLAVVKRTLSLNTTDLTGAIGLTYGPEGAFAFDQLWKQHIQFFANYAAATTRAQRDKAMRDLRDYNMDFSSFTSTATGGRAPLSAVVGLIHTHVAQLISQIDAYRRGDMVSAVAHQHEARVHMYEISAALAGALADQQPITFPGGAPSSATVEAAHLRSEGAQLTLDAAWSTQFRPALVAALTAEVHTLALDDTQGATASRPCVARIAAHDYDGAAECSRSLLLDLSA